MHDRHLAENRLNARFRSAYLPMAPGRRVSVDVSLLHEIEADQT
jgi:hypothetical protein